MQRTNRRISFENVDAQLSSGSVRRFKSHQFRHSGVGNDDDCDHAHGRRRSVRAKDGNGRARNDVDVARGLWRRAWICLFETWHNRTHGIRVTAGQNGIPFAKRIRKAKLHFLYLLPLRGERGSSARRVSNSATFPGSLCRGYSEIITRQTLFD